MLIIILVSAKRDDGSRDEKGHGGKVSMVAPEEVHNFSSAGFRSVKMHPSGICLTIA